MTVSLPQSVAAASGWQLVDWIDLPLITGLAAGGTAQLETRQLAMDEMWLVDRAVVQCDSTTDTKLRLYTTSANPQRLLSGSDTGNFDEAEYPAGLLVRPSETLLAIWTGVSAGARGTLRLQARQLRRA